MKNLTFIIFIIVSSSLAQKVSIVKVGCFKKTDLNLFKKSEIKFDIISVQVCVIECHSKYKRFAALYNGDTCLCGEQYKGIESENCNIPCRGMKNETCGGKSSVSLYETAGGKLGAPTSIVVVEKTETTIKIAWKNPEEDLDSVIGYSISAEPIFYFNEVNHPIKKYYKYSSPLTNMTILDGLQPGTKYAIDVRVTSNKGDGYPAFVDEWTVVGEPLKPKIPEILSRSSNSMVVQLHSVIPTGGPITSYRIVVVDETIPVIVQYDFLLSYNEALNNGLPYYIAAEFGPNEFESIFTVGDGKYYGKYYNSLLKPNRDYHILLGVISTVNETKYSYSDSDHSQHEGSHITFDSHHENEEQHSVDDSSESANNSTVLGLSIAIALFAFFLLVSVIIYFALRVHFKRTLNHATDHQELAVHAHNPNQDFENGYAVGAHYVEDEVPQPDHYRLLREKINIFPHQNIRIIGDLGSGKFGCVKKSVMANSGREHSTVLVHQIADNSLDIAKKKQMLSDLDHHIKIAVHENVLSLLGLMEDFNIISVIFQYESTTLKSQLEESRAVQHYPVYAEKNRRFSTFHESQLMNILLGVLRGMMHLSSLKIPHGQLCARNVVLKDGILPKLSGFGLTHFHNDVYIPDYRRWQSPEYLRSNQASCFGDIWSYGCLLWECVTLGGTPYAEIRTEDLATRIVRGLRLPQPEYIGDELYQLMLLCWQNDPDERPKFSNLETELKRLTQDDITPHLLFSLYPSFSYESFSPHLEFLD